MRRLLSVVAAIGLAAMLMTFAMAERALVIDENDNVVALLNENGDIMKTIGDGMRVVTNSANGTTIYTAHVVDVPNSLGRAITWDFDSTGIRCGIVRSPGNICISDQWSETISASGRANLRCTCRDE